MSDQIDDSELKALLNFLIVLAGDIEKIVAKGSLSLLDLPGLYGAFSAASSALSGIKQLPEEISSMNDASIADLRAYIQAQLPSAVSSPVIDGVVNDGLSLAQELFDFVNSVRSAKNPPAAPAAPAAPVVS